jgi:CRP/FNR family cyclic AMP-dependent transcriptional regulator
MSKLSFSEKVAILKRTEVFEGFPDMVLKSISDVVEEVSVNEGNTFIYKGEEGTCMYILFKGKLKVHDEDAKIAEVEPVSVIGEMAILTTEPRTASVTAMEDSKLLKINQTEFEILSDDNIDFYKSIVKLLINKLQKQNAELAEFARNARRIASLF